jgi:bacterioferritin-associated ferredoxin
MARDIDQHLGLHEGPVLAYDDPQRSIGKRVRIDHGRITAIRLAGETLAQHWLLNLWREGRADEQLRRWLLAPLSAPPGQAGASAAGDKTLCNCKNVSQSAVCAGIARGLDLQGLKQELGCGTQCGSCVPEIKRLLAPRRDRSRSPREENTMNAKVWLVGAGPGDPELLTLKAVRALREADVVLIDDLVNDAVLEHCVGARIIPVGKRGGCRSTPQAFIHRLMLRYARQGKCVVRLKGGDPAFSGAAAKRRVVARTWGGGRIGQWHHRRTGGRDTVRYSADPARCRARRDAGHRPYPGRQSLNWQALAQGGTTLVIYMGVAKLAKSANSCWPAEWRRICQWR